jgi:DNA mismatch repair ATPase MutS
VFVQTLSDTMRQYWTVKARYLDCLVLMQIGSFYEAFDMDANIIHK